MKQIILVRHAKADDKKKSEQDIQRGLQNKGRFQAKDLAKKLARRVKKPQIFISSPAKRALETAHIFEKHWQSPSNAIKIVDELYHHSGETAYFDILKSLSESISSAIIFGHDPAITGVAVNLCSTFSKRLPTNGILVLGFNVSEWKNIEPQSGKIIYYNFPREKRKNPQEAQSHIYHDIYNKLSEALGHIDESEFRNKEKFIKKWSFQITTNIAKIIQKNKSTLH
ncbi:MAG: histidine phosphatase family protein [Spirochaetales bacterium]|nr:histidine phosphatase family protein [Spirochaetales bacterium]